MPVNRAVAGNPARVTVRPRAGTIHYDRRADRFRHREVWGECDEAAARHRAFFLPGFFTTFMFSAIVTARPYFLR